MLGLFRAVFWPDRFSTDTLHQALDSTEWTDFGSNVGPVAWPEYEEPPPGTVQGNDSDGGKDSSAAAQHAHAPRVTAEARGNTGGSGRQ